jgi:hypothetical protein
METHQNFLILFFKILIFGKISPVNKRLFYIHPVGASIVLKEEPKVLDLG